MMLGNCCLTHSRAEMLLIYFMLIIWFMQWDLLKINSLLLTRWSLIFPAIRLWHISTKLLTSLKKACTRLISCMGHSKTVFTNKLKPRWTHTVLTGVYLIGILISNTMNHLYLTKIMAEVWLLMIRPLCKFMMIDHIYKSMAVSHSWIHMGS